MKKHLFILLTLILSLGTCVAVRASELNTVSVVFDITASEGNSDFTAKVGLSDEISAYETTVDIKADDTTATATFEVEPFEAGKIFNFYTISGFDSVQFYSVVCKPGDVIELPTYSYLQDDGTAAHVSTFHMHAIPVQTKRVDYYKDYKPYTLSPGPRYYDGTLYVPAAAGGRSLDIEYIEYDIETGKITYPVYGKSITLYVGSKEVNCLGNTYTMDKEVITFDEIPYIPLISFASIVDSEVVIQNEGTHINAVVSGSQLLKREAKYKGYNDYVNKAGLRSDTKYLIWVSKADYKLRVFEGSKGNWSMIKEFTCAIGANATPTCTGTFKYYERVSRWAYSSYYVGPIMRFNGGYAIHTTLLRYNGVPYDNRVGMKLSHGCVRLQPQDMYWLIDTAPLYTTVHITNY